MELNASKMRRWSLISVSKDLPSTIKALYVSSQEIMVQEYKYMGTTIDQRLIFKPNTEKIFQIPVMSLLPSKTLQAPGSSVCSFNILAWFRGMKNITISTLHKIISVSTKITGSGQEDNLQ